MAARAGHPAHAGDPARRGLGWWRSVGIEYVAFGFNIALLFAWGLSTARARGRTWHVARAIGCADALLGVVVVVAGALIK